MKIQKSQKIITVLQMLVLVAITAACAFAQGGITDGGSFTTTTATVVRLVQQIAGAGVFVCLCLAIFKFVGRDMSGGFTYVLGVIAGGIIVGYAPSWTAAITGTSIQ